jgi:hypothetical protein
MNRRTEQNGKEEDERNQYEVLSVQGSPLLLEKESKEAFRRRPPCQKGLPVISSARLLCRT